MIVIVGGCIKNRWRALGRSYRLQVTPGIDAEALPPAGRSRRGLTLRRRDPVQSVVGESLAASTGTDQIVDDGGGVTIILIGRAVPIAQAK